MWFKWKKKALQLQQKNISLEAENTQQRAHIQQLQEALAAHKAARQATNSSCSLIVVFQAT